MNMSGEIQIAAPRAVVWQGLNDPDVLKRCIPGCETIEKTSDTEFSARVALSVGPVKARFTGKVQLLDLDPPNGYRISGEGQGGVAGFGKGGATVRLADADGGTLLSYTAESTVGGKIAQLGARLIDSTAKKLADEFFAKFAAAMTEAAAPAAPAPAADGAPAAQVEPAATEAAPAQAPAPAPVPAGSPALQPMIWIPALVFAVAVIWFFFARG